MSGRGRGGEAVDRVRGGRGAAPYGVSVCGTVGDRQATGRGVVRPREKRTEMVFVCGSAEKSPVIRAGGLSSREESRILCIADVGHIICDVAVRVVNYASPRVGRLPCFIHCGCHYGARPRIRISAAVGMNVICSSGAVGN